jgi:hypothetical protein
MTPTAVDKLILVLATVVAAVGAVDAAVGHAYDLLVVFGLAGLLQLVLRLRLQSRRPAVPLRADLVRWLEDRSSAQGESMGSLADRCVAAWSGPGTFAPSHTGRAGAGWARPLREVLPCMHR